MKKKLHFCLSIIVIIFHVGILGCNDDNYEEIALIWMQASINGDKIALDKNTNWERRISDINPKDIEAFEMKKGSILEGHAFYSDVAGSNNWTESMLATLKITTSKKLKDEAFVEFKFIMDNKPINVKLSLSKVNEQWKIFKDE